MVNVDIININGHTLQVNSHSGKLSIADVEITRMTIPNDNGGTNGQFLQTDGSGLLSWADAGAGALTFIGPLAADGNQVELIIDDAVFQVDENNNSLLLQDHGVQNVHLQHSWIGFAYSNGLSGDESVELGDSVFIEISQHEEITMQNVVLTSAAAIGASEVSIKGVNGEFSGNLQCQNLTLSSTLSIGGLTTIDGGLTMTSGAANFQGASVQVSTPTTGSNPATKEYVDSIANRFFFKNSVRAATSGYMPDEYNELAAEAVDADNINIYVLGSTDLIPDGSDPNDGGRFESANYSTTPLEEPDPLAHRLLMKNLLDAKQHGVYFIRSVDTSAAQTLYDGTQYDVKWSLRRTSDFNAASDVSHGAYVFVEAGERNKHTSFMMTNENANVSAVDGDDIYWTTISGAGALTFIGPLAADGNQVELMYDGAVFQVDENNNSLLLQDHGVQNGHLQHSWIGFNFSNGLSGDESIELGDSIAIEISQHEEITMQNVVLTSTAAIGAPEVSIKGVHGEFSGDLQCVNLFQISDQRVKEWEVMDVAECLYGINALEPMVYSLKQSFVDIMGGSTEKHMGLLAQPLEGVFPHAVNTSSMPVQISTEETVQDMKSVDYASLVAPLIGAIKALSAKVASLEARIA